jgi:hypothetical protein
MRHLQESAASAPGHRGLRGYRLLLALAALLTSSASEGKSRDLTLARAGTALAVIVADPSLTVAESFAARELKQYLDQITGADFRVVPSAEGPRQARILIGPSAEVRTLLPDVEWDGLKPDTIVIRTVANCLILAGDRPRGTVYAVYTFLEEQLGCRWWSQVDAQIPRLQTLRLPRALNIVYTPPFHYRAILCKHMEREPGPFGAQLKLNGDFPTPEARYGGHQSTIKMGHSFHYLLPPQTYFGAHPTWYGLHKGVRAATLEGGRPNQMCLSNSEMRQELVKRALHLIQAEPTAGVISVGQEDGTPPCACTDCLALDAALGGQTGTLLCFVNQVADAVREVYPRVMVETLAYQWSINPPTVPTRVRDNVLVRIATINTDFATPLDSPRNRTFDELVQRWRKVSSNLAIYDYSYNYHNQLMSFPLWNIIGANIRYYAENSITAIMVEGDDFNSGANFARLRAWLMAHLMWDPSADQRGLTRQFLEGYYGDAGPYLEKYIDLTAHAAVQNTTFMACWSDDVCFLAPAELKRAKRYFDRAEAAVADDPVRRDRVQIERLAFDHQLLLSRLVMPAVSDVVSAASRDERARNFVTLSAATGNDFIVGRTKLREDYVDILTGRKEIAASGQPLPATRQPATLPTVCKDLARRDWADLQEGQFILGSLCTVAADNDASNGVAIQIPAGPSDWVLQAPVFSRNCLKPSVDLYVSASLTTRQTTGPAFAVKVYNLATGEYALSRTVDISECAGSAGYTEIKLGPFQPSEAQYIVFEPLNNTAGIDRIAVDRFFLVRRH